MMITKFIEATDATEFNWGKFLVAKFTQTEWERPSFISPGSSLLNQVGWSAHHILVMDLQTGEGGIFSPGGSAKYDLDKHKIWVCPMYEPFLEWLYKQPLDDLPSLPCLVDLGDVPTAMAGYRRGPAK